MYLLYMNLLFDLGGTHFRYYITNKNNLIYEQKIKRDSELRSIMSRTTINYI